MSTPEQTPDGAAVDPPRRADRVGASGSRVARALVVIAIGVVLVVALAYAMAAFVPRSWAQWVGDRVDGSLLSGTVWGLFIGFTCTLLPLTVLWLAAKRWVARGWTIALVLAAVILALPNLMTLAVVLGTNDSAHAGERILDVDGPGFRAGSLWGALLGAAAFVVVVWLARSRRSRGRRVRDLQEEARQRDAQARPDAPEAATGTGASEKRDEAPAAGSDPTTGSSGVARPPSDS